ncbi:MAG: DUF2752 domain-containing protein [Oscillospiraceae bacterium]|nr:DUF2752 domain-containing protein [Oscillospiraceae bacterium]
MRKAEHTNPVRARLLKYLCFAGLAAVVFSGLAAIYFRFGYGIPCAFRAATGLLCPGCGVTRATFALLRLDFRAAFEYNALYALLLPWLVFLAVIYSKDYILLGKFKRRRYVDIACYVFAGFLLIFSIIRNFI